LGFLKGETHVEQIQRLYENPVLFLAATAIFIFVVVANGYPFNEAGKKSRRLNDEKKSD